MTLRFPVRLAAPLAAILIINGCASGSEAIYQGVKVLWASDDTGDGKPLNPGFSYLRVIAQNHRPLLVLGNVELHPEGAVEVWYSAKREVLRIQNGRIVGTAGLETNWTNVRYDKFPAWSTVGKGSILLHRTRDEAPGYRLGIKETLELRAIAPPSDSKLAGLDPKTLSWFEERPVSEATEPMPTSRFAVEFNNSATPPVDRVIYAEQCLSTTLCLIWQRWPAHPTILHNKETTN